MSKVKVKVVSELLNLIGGNRSQRGLFFSLFFLCSSNISASPKWEVLENPVPSAPAIVEFFSFYCPPCYAFSQTMRVDYAIQQVLPEENSMVKYHVSLLGQYGHELTQAWALSMVMNVTEQVEKAFFTAMMVEGNLHSPEDIRRVFITATGISGEIYDREIKSQAVKEKVALQEKLFDEYGVRSTPSVYVRGQYYINNSAFGSLPVETYRARYVDVIRKLLKQ